MTEKKAEMSQAMKEKLAPKQFVKTPINGTKFTILVSSAKQVTQERMYLETMEKVLADIDKVIIDKNASSGVVPYLPLPELKKKDPK